MNLLSFSSSFYEILKNNLYLVEIRKLWTFKVWIYENKREINIWDVDLVVLKLNGKLSSGNFVQTTL